MNLLVSCVFTLQDVMNKVRSDNMLDMTVEKSSVKELVGAGGNTVT